MLRTSKDLARRTEPQGSASRPGKMCQPAGIFPNWWQDPAFSQIFRSSLQKLATPWRITACRPANTLNATDGRTHNVNQVNEAKSVSSRARLEQPTVSPCANSNEPD